jgi:hypothetical protein
MKQLTKPDVFPRLLEDFVSIFKFNGGFMHFLKLTLVSGRTTYINIAAVYEIQATDSHGSQLFIAGSGGDVVIVMESPTDILAKC